MKLESDLNKKIENLKNEVNKLGKENEEIKIERDDCDKMRTDIIRKNDIQMKALNQNLANLRVELKQQKEKLDLSELTINTIKGNNLEMEAQLSNSIDDQNKLLERCITSEKLCGCNTIFDIESGLKALKINSDSHRKNANKRLDEIVGTFCMMCCADSSRSKEDESHLDFTLIKIKDAQVNNNKSNSNNKNNQQALQKKNTSSSVNNLKDEELKYISTADHVLCLNCIDDYSRQLINNNNKNNKNSNDKKESSNVSLDNKNASIICYICEAEHGLDPKVRNNIVKKKACCQGGCEIF